MKFNEKLIKLRKQNGLSQEELGYKLNVTRQTVSKWELGQTTPEMDKLVSLSKIYGITLDELTSEDESTVIEEKNAAVNKENSSIGNENPIKSNNEKSDKKKFDISNIDMRKILIPLLIVLVIIALAIGIYKVKVANKIINSANEINQEANDTSNFVIKFIKDIINQIAKQNEEFDNEENKIEKERFNSQFENGTKYRNYVKDLLDKVITNNKTEEEHIITVSYKEKETSNPNDIAIIKKELVSDSKDAISDLFVEYEVSLEYDNNGYVNKIAIEYLGENSTVKNMKDDYNNDVKEMEEMVNNFKQENNM